MECHPEESSGPTTKLGLARMELRSDELVLGRPFLELSEVEQEMCTSVASATLVPWCSAPEELASSGYLPPDRDILEQNLLSGRDIWSLSRAGPAEPVCKEDVNAVHPGDLCKRLMSCCICRQAHGSFSIDQESDAV